MKATSMNFVPNYKGLVEMRNSDFIQNTCLDKAREVASVASASTGKQMRCDVQPGKSRCHARATLDVPKTPKNEWYGGAFKNAAAAVVAATEACGGTKSKYYKPKGK